MPSVVRIYRVVDLLVLWHCCLGKILIACDVDMVLRYSLPQDAKFCFWIWESEVLVPFILSLVTWKRGFKALIASFFYLAHKTDKYCVFRFLSFIARALCIDSPMTHSFLFLFLLTFFLLLSESMMLLPENGADWREGTLNGWALEAIYRRLVMERRRNCVNKCVVRLYL